MIAQRRATYAGFATRELFVEGGGPVVVLLHGFADCADTWHGVLTELARAGRAAVAVDLPSFGQADPLRPGPRLVQLDEFAAEVISAHGDAGVIVVGNSLGGAVAVRSAQRPELPVAGVMPVGTVGMGFGLGARIASVRDGAAVNGILRMPLPQRLLGSSMRRTLRRLMYGDPRTADPVLVERMAAQFDDRRSAAVLLRTAAAYTVEVRDCLEPDKVRCPMAIVHGARDLLVPVTASRRLHACVPHSTLVVLPDAGHCPQLDDPRTVAHLAVDLAAGMQPA